MVKVLYSIYMYYTPGSGDILVESTQNNNNNTSTVTVNMFISPPVFRLQHKKHAPHSNVHDTVDSKTRIAENITFG